MTNFKSLTAELLLISLLPLCWRWANETWVGWWTRSSQLCFCSKTRFFPHPSLLRKRCASPPLNTQTPARTPPLQRSHWRKLWINTRSKGTSFWASWAKSPGTTRDNVGIWRISPWFLKASSERRTTTSNSPRRTTKKGARKLIVV